ANVYNALKSGNDVTAKVLISRDAHVASDAAKLLEYAKNNGLTPVDYFELGIQIQTGDNNMMINKLNHPVTYTMDLGGINTSQRKFFVLRLHDGNIDKLPVYVKGNQGSFQTDSYSTYMLAYQNILVDENTSGTKTVNVKGSDENTTTTATSKKTTIKSSKSTKSQKAGKRYVDTGDYTAIFETVALAGASLLGIFVTRKKEEENK
ncbi:MAG: hypothetical protein ACI4WQ_00535, partial [Sharpea porci]